MIHFAGVYVEIGPLLRQRCSWCGAVLCDDNLALVAVPEGWPTRPPAWEVGALVEVDGPMSYVVEHVDGDPLPAGTCAHIDPHVTL